MKRKRKFNDIRKELLPSKTNFNYKKYKFNEDNTERKTKDFVNHLSTIKKTNLMDDNESNLITKPNLKQRNLCSRIQRDFFFTDAVTLAQRLLGKIIVRVLDGEIIKCRIVETEAYMGELDKGSHVHKVGKTERTKAFWMSGGHLYIYTIYGIHFCMNIIANDENTPQGCLIREAEPLEGIDLIVKNRGSNDEKNLTNGPGKLTAALNVDKSFNRIYICESEQIYLIENQDDYPFTVGCSSRVNIDYAEEYKDKPWRFYFHNNKYVSKVKK